MNSSIIVWQRGTLPALLNSISQRELDLSETKSVQIDPRPTRAPPSNADTPLPLIARLEPGTYFEAQLEWSAAHRLLVLPDQGDGCPLRWAWRSCPAKETRHG